MYVKKITALLEEHPEMADERYLNDLRRYDEKIKPLKQQLQNRRLTDKARQRVETQLQKELVAWMQD
jgi:hypothetical protein